MKLKPRLLIVLTLMLAHLSCNNAPKETQNQMTEAVDTEVVSSTGVRANGPFAHTVYFWLNDPESIQAHTSFQESLKNFILKSPDITTFHIGKPARTDRPVIDSSYSYALLLTFKDKAAQDRYQDDPAHKLFIKESEALWSKVVVYDSENILN